MEVSSVSPSPASSTEGDDVCEIDVTSMAIHSVTLLICICGLTGNGAVLCFLNLKIGNYDLFDLAVVDFLFLLFTVPSALLFLVEDVSCSPIVPLLYVNFVFQLSLVSCYWALFWLMRSRNLLYLRDFYTLCCGCDLPERLWLVVDTVQYWAVFALFTVIPMVTFLCPSHQQEQCRAALISMYAIIVLLFAAPVLISGTIDLINAKRGSQQQQPKRHDVVILFIVLLSVLFILCTFLQQLGYIAVSSQVFFLLTCINSSIKPFIYFPEWTSWRRCSMCSLRLSPQAVSEVPEEDTACRNDLAVDTGI